MTEGRTTRAVGLGLLLLLVMGTGAWAQDLAEQRDPFAHIHAHLNDAASRTLERVLQPVPDTSPAPPVPVKEEAPPAVGHPAAAQRVERLRPLLEPILRDAGVPAGLTAVVLVESGGNPAALSPKGARGLWQFMPETARRYGLAVDGGRDERLDVLKSTRAAARYLRDLHARFGDWRLAFAAYNAGAGAVERASQRAGSRDFSVLETHLPEETRGYVPEVLAAMNSARSPRLVAEPVRIVFASPQSQPTHIPGKEIQ